MKLGLLKKMVWLPTILSIVFAFFILAGLQGVAWELQDIDRWLFAFDLIEFERDIVRIEHIIKEVAR